MSKYIYIGLLLLLVACQKEDIVSYDLEKDCIQFDFPQDEMSFSYNFAEQFVYDEYQRKYIYFGDSITRDTISLYLSLMGRASDVDREFKLKVVPIAQLDTLPLTEVGLEPSYVFRANQLKDTIQVVLFRPQKRGHFGVGLTLDIEDGNAIFDSGVEELGVYELFILDRYEKPDDWDYSVDYLGEYSEEKYAFMVSVLQNRWAYDWSQYNSFLRETLEKFNNEHPDNPKDFTFPVYTKPGWWDYVAYLLGEYSEEKRTFLIETIGENRYNYQLSSLPYYPNVMQELKDAYDAYNTEHPDAPLPFPQFPG